MRHFVLFLGVATMVFGGLAEAHAVPSFFIGTSAGEDFNSKRIDFESAALGIGVGGLNLEGFNDDFISAASVDFPIGGPTQLTLADVGPSSKLIVSITGLCERGGPRR